MPELPDVEVFRDAVEENALDRVVETVSLKPGGMLQGTSEGTLRSALKGNTLTAVRRHGKHLFIRSGEERGRWLRLHFGMTGELRVYGEEEGEPDHTRLRLDFRGGDHLAFRCPRKFGEIGLVADPGTFVEEKGLGPDLTADGFGLRDFRKVLDGRRGTVKGTLMNQEVLAGLGNVYTDEALFQAGLHPETPVDDLSRDGVAELWRSVRKVLEKSVEYRADRDRMPSTWLLAARGRGGEGTGCPRCDGTLRTTEVSGRATWLCDRHQTKGG